MNRMHASPVMISLFLALAPSALASITWYVDGVNGNDGKNCASVQTACKTIGHAISLAASADSIMVAAATYTENLTISISLTVIGSGAATTIVDGGGDASVVTISSARAHVTLFGLTIRNGRAPIYGGGIFNLGTLTLVYTNVTGNTVGRQCSSCSALGGGIYNGGGTVTISSSTISGNRASLYSTNTFPYGGGIANNSGTMTINKSTISGNTAWHPQSNTSSRDYGAGIANLQGTLTINNSTISENKATYVSYGGGISNGGTVTISNSTISGNIATHGGGISGSAKIQNTIIANNPNGGNCSGTLISEGYNLSSDSTCNFNGPGDLNNHDPMLGPLQNNGGPTQTMALLPGSLAIDGGNPAGCTDGQGHLLTTDQRGMPRPDKEDSVGCDMGAYESQTD
jgi:hypothetical protein